MRYPDDDSVDGVTARSAIRFSQTREKVSFLLAAGYFFKAYDLIGLRAFCALDNVKLDLIAFLEALVAFALDGTVMNKDIGSVVTPEETVSLCIVEPLDCTFVMCQDPNSLMTFQTFRGLRWGGLSKRV
jgi:hypothetical protein